MNVYLSIYLSDQLGAAAELSSGILLDPRQRGLNGRLGTFIHVTTTTTIRALSGHVHQGLLISSSVNAYFSNEKIKQYACLHW
jgi:hypothetical protein